MTANVLLLCLTVLAFGLVMLALGMAVELERRHDCERRKARDEEEEARRERGELPGRWIKG